jgi:hypothetical protein
MAEQQDKLFSFCLQIGQNSSMKILPVDWANQQNENIFTPLVCLVCWQNESMFILLVCHSANFTKVRKYSSSKNCCLIEAER